MARHGWIVVLAGWVFLTLSGNGGDDGYRFYLKPWWPDATAPAWVFLLTAPANPLAWPLRWTLLTAVTIVAAVFAQRATGEKRWWIILFNHAFISTLWLGQIEIIIVVGAALTWLVMERRFHPLWLGIGMVLMFTKIQVSFGLILLFAFWIFREQGVRPFVWAAASMSAVTGITLLIYPGWIDHYLVALRNLAPQDQAWNAAIFPLGLIAVPLALYPGDVGKRRRARMIACATLLASPYFAWYHPTTAMLFETRGAMIWLSWLDALPRAMFNLMSMGWITPTVMLLWDVWQIRSERSTDESR